MMDRVMTITLDRLHKHNGPINDEQLSQLKQTVAFVVGIA
jgi:hypothetical protein